MVDIGLSSDVSTGDGTISLQILVGLAVSLAGLPILTNAVMEVYSPEGIAYALLGSGLEWVVALSVLGLVAYWERRRLSSIGIDRPTAGDVLWGLGAFVVGILAFAATAPVVRALGLGTTQSGISAAQSVPVAILALMAVTAGITEEILYRGYPIERLTEVTGDVRTGAAVAYVAFVLIHYPVWGPGATVQIGAFSLVVTGLYVRRRSLAACVVMHVCNNLFAYILAPLLFGAS